MKRVIYTEVALNLWIDVAGYLKKKYGWEPVYWVGSEWYTPKAQVDDAFPGIIYHENFDAVRNIPPVELKDMPWQKVSPALLEQLLYCESVTMKMMDRMDPFLCFSYEQRKHLYYRYIEYWSAVLDRLKPDLVISPVSPHLMYDYVLYWLCKLRGIKTLFQRGDILKELTYISENIRTPDPRLYSLYKKRLAEAAPPQLSQLTADYIDDLRGNSDKAIPYYMRNQMASAKSEGRLTKYLKKALYINRYPRYISNRFKMVTAFKQFHYYKLAGKPIDERAHFNYADFRKFKSSSQRNVQQLRQVYDSIADPNATSYGPYIYVALMFQPERTSTPEADLCTDQYLMISYLAKTVPENVTIVVKEHPSQFLLYIEQQRPIDFYDRFREFRNVKLAPLSNKSTDLIKNSLAIATLTGSVGMEAVILGKPVITFGSAWYNGCEGVFNINQPGFDESLLKICGGEIHPSLDKIKLFLSCVEEIGFRAKVEPVNNEEVKLSQEENIKNIAEALHTYVANDERDGI